jgi:hypothetical protein
MNPEEHRMITRYHKTDDSGGSGEVRKTPEKQRGAVHDDTCRCKETSKMTPRELLGLMMSDLAFWKKTKKE